MRSGMIFGAMSLVLALGSVAFAGQVGDGLQGDRDALRAAEVQVMKDRLPVIDARIKLIQDRLAAHPNAPAEVVAAVNKLVSDLQTRKAALEKLIADFQAKNKEGVKADRAQLQALHATIKADWQALHALIQKDHAQWKNQGARAGAGARRK